MKKNRTIFLGGLDSNILVKNIDSYFHQFGEIKNIILRKKNNQTENQTSSANDQCDNKKLNITLNSNKKNYAYVVFTLEESIHKVFQIERHSINGRRIDCQIAHGGKDKAQDVNNMIETKIH